MYPPHVNMKNVRKTKDILVKGPKIAGLEISTLNTLHNVVAWTKKVERTNFVALICLESLQKCHNPLNGQKMAMNQDPAKMKPKFVKFGLKDIHRAANLDTKVILL